MCSQVTHSRAHVSRIHRAKKRIHVLTCNEAPHMHSLWKPVLMERKHLYDICILTSLPLVAVGLTVPLHSGTTAAQGLLWTHIEHSSYSF